MPISLPSSLWLSLLGALGGLAPLAFLSRSSSLSADEKRSADSLSRLAAFVAKHPRIDVRLGHQLLPARDAATAAAR